MSGLFDLTGKIALVTGGSRGLGLEMALAFAEAGADVLIASRRLEACEEAARQVRARGCRSAAIAVHAGKWNEMERLHEEARQALGPVDIVVNNAGMGPQVPSPEVSEDLFDKVIGLNFKGPFRLSALVGADMAARGGGSIINISSGASWKAMPQVVPYAGAKAALNAMTISLAQEFAPHVRVNAIAAGPFLTDIAKAWNDEQRETAPNAVGRPGMPGEIVSTALYLASPASSYVTGAVIRCDGGLR